MPWNINNDTGLAELDLQHRKLMRLVRDLHGALSAGKKAGDLTQVLTALTTVTQLHFRSEERLMGVYRYPLAELHATRHRELLERLGGMGDPTAEDLLVILGLLTMHHDQGPDAQFAAFMRGIQGR